MPIRMTKSFINFYLKSPSKVVWTSLDLVVEDGKTENEKVFQ